MAKPQDALMTDEIEDPIEKRLETMQRRAENFRDLLKDDEEIIISLDHGDVRVDESYRSRFERKHPKLFGRMLSIETQIDAGFFPYFAALLLTGILIVGLHLGWWESVIGKDLSDYLQSWWLYLVLPIFLLYLARLFCARWEKYVYRRNRGQLLELIAAEQIDRDVLMVMLRDEGELENVLYHLKLDTGA